MSVREPATGVLLLAVLAAAVVFVLAWPPAAPPPVIPASAEAGAFSAERARVHLRELTRSPRPIGSAAHAEVRAYLLDALRQLGLDPELQHATGVRRSGDTIRAAALVNIVARLPGVASSGAIVLLAHYDSVPNSPGAGDAGNGVAAILETVRALRAGPPMRNDVIVLITDAEEVGLLGAQAYVDEHPWATDTGIVLNAEGRGHAGPVYMFRTTASNGRMIRTLGRAAPYPAAESLANEIFRLMPNDTDLTVFQQAGYAGMDFANVRSLTHYHTPLDNYENADPRTLQHHGEYLLSLARAFGAMDLEKLAGPDRIYFSVPVLGLLHYPLTWALPLALLALLLVAGVTARAGRRKLLRANGVGIALLHLAAAMVVLPLAAMLAWRLLAGHIPEVAWSWHGSPYDSGRYLLGISLLVMGLYLGSVAWLRRRMSPPDMLVAALIAWLALSLVSAWRLPGASYLFLWPLVFATIGLERWSADASRRPAAQAAVLAVLALPTLLFVSTLVAGMEEALTLAWIAAPSALLVLGLGLLALPLSLVASGLGRALPASLLLLGVAVLGMALHGAGIDAERKKANSLHYIVDLDEEDARWYSLDPAPDEWTGLYLGDAPERAALPGWAPAQLAGPDGIAWQRQAPVLRVAGPQAELLSDTPTVEGRRLRLRISTPAGSHHTTIRFAGKAGISGLSIDGRELPSGPDPDTRAGQLLYFAMPARGVEVEVVTVGTEPLRVYLRANILGLPPMADGAAPLRPDHMMPAGQLGDLSRLQRTFEF
jgi:hypothetical protein